MSLIRKGECFIFPKIYFMTHSEIITWLLEGDVSIQYQVHRDILGQHRTDLQKRIPKEGWGKAFLDVQRSDGHWGRGFYQVKWIKAYWVPTTALNWIQNMNSFLKTVK